MSSVANSSVSAASLAHTLKGKSLAASPSQIKPVVTSPPWARDEPPSPDEDDFLVVPYEGSIARSPSDSVSHQSADAGPSRWWIFTRTRSPRDRSVNNQVSGVVEHDPNGYSLRDRSRPWISPPDLWQSKERHGRTSYHSGLHISLPAPTTAAHTVVHNHISSWDSPWTPRFPPSRFDNQSSYYQGQIAEVEVEKQSSQWKRKLRSFLLTNPYVPLLFRFMNITFTTSALALAIRIRQLEKQNNAMGAVGSSPTLAIIFAPLTLVHVMISIYLEYFGRPLGLWRTSGKLAHTLLETFFICAWSAALSLCFDNYFTSIVPCTTSGTSWYKRIPPSYAVPYLDGVGGKICDYQLALIVLVAIGLIMYCMNLITSLFRIFEKVKYHPAHAAQYQ